VVDSAREELEVRGDTDRWGRPGSEWEREEGKLGRAGFVGRKRRWAGGVGKRRKNQKKRKRGRSSAGLGREERKRGLGVWRVLGFFLFSKKTFQIFSNFKLFFNFSNFQNILKLHTNKQKHHAFKL
jgi:hypothetical protein